MEEIYHSVAQQLEEERRRRIAAVQTMSVAEKSNTDLKEKLKTEEQLRKSAEAALKGVRPKLRARGNWSSRSKDNWLRPRSKLQL